MCSMSAAVSDTCWANTSSSFGSRRATMEWPDRSATSSLVKFGLARVAAAPRSVKLAFCQ
jgi:hypothetical protein